MQTHLTFLDFFDISGAIQLIPTVRQQPWNIPLHQADIPDCFAVVQQRLFSPGAIR